jgi:uncharacterized protein (TIRG00374 family)
MKTGTPLLAAAIATVLYVLALLWVDSTNQVLARLPLVAATLPVLAAASLLSYVLRYARWQWLLRRAHAPTPVLRGWLAYLTGFAFTATPGKVGELVRIRYFAEFGVPPEKVLAAFVFERASDLLAITLFAALTIHDPAVFLVVLGFMVGLLGLIVLVASRPASLAALSTWLRRRKLGALARLARMLRKGLTGCRTWLNAPDIVVAMALGLLAWGVVALSFAWLLARLGLTLPFTAAMSLYPTAMLAGAASMLPGGIGTTEFTIVALLAMHAVPVGTATLAAVAIRFAGLWFAIGCGLLSIGVLERGGRQNKRGA